VTVTTSRDIDVALAPSWPICRSTSSARSTRRSTKPVILGAAEPQILLPFDNAAAFE
jgi:membrane-bound lytic murein transglycosylase D